MIDSEQNLSPSSTNRKRKDGGSSYCCEKKRTGSESPSETCNSVKSERSTRTSSPLSSSPKTGSSGALGSANSRSAKDPPSPSHPKSFDGPSRAKPAILQEKQNKISYLVVNNDGKPISLRRLNDLKIVIQHQLPKMPKEYITRLVFARNHYSMIVLVNGAKNTCLGGITFLPFPERKFAEVVFLAVEGAKQTHGYGSRLMAHFKDYVKVHFGINYLLTYADNLAIGYFKKQGFSTDITLKKSEWVGCIKDYEEATILQCSFYPKVKYAELDSILDAQRKAVYRKIKEHVSPIKVYEGIKDFDERKFNSPIEIPGIQEAGWTPESETAMDDSKGGTGSLCRTLRKIVSDMRSKPSAWPFLEPVTGVPDYYDVIKEPMNLHAVSDLIDSGKYDSFKAFEKDIYLIFNNCRIYNDESTAYVRCANTLEKWFKSRISEYEEEIATYGGQTTNGD